MTDFLSLYTRCRECLAMMFVHKDNHDVVYCNCEGLELGVAPVKEALSKQKTS